MEKKLGALIEQGLGLKTDVFVRDGGDLAAVIAANPFPTFAKKDPSHLLIHFLKQPLTAAEKKAVAEATQAGPEEAQASGREIYVSYPAGIARSKLKLPVEGTARNWNTVAKLSAMAHG